MRIKFQILDRQRRELAEASQVQVGVGRACFPRPYCPLPPLSTSLGDRGYRGRGVWGPGGWVPAFPGGFPQLDRGFNNLDVTAVALASCMGFDVMCLPTPNPPPTP